MNNIFFFVFVGVVFIIVLSVLFTKKGTNTFVDVAFGGNVIKDWGDIGTTNVRGISQTVRLLQCNKDGEIFFVLAISVMASKQFIKISEQMADNLISMLSSAKQ